MRSSEKDNGKAPSQLIDERIEELGDWRGEVLARIRSLIKEADPEVVEEWKWRGVPTWYHEGIICTGVRMFRMRMSYLGFILVGVCWFAPMDAVAQDSSPAPAYWISVGFGGGTAGGTRVRSTWA